MKTRDDLHGVAETVLRFFGGTDLPGYAMLRDRITTELHDAYDAGQEAGTALDDDRRDELIALRTLELDMTIAENRLGSLPFGLPKLVLRAGKAAEVAVAKVRELVRKRRMEIEGSK